MIGGMSPKNAFLLTTYRGKQFARSPPLSAQDADSWRLRERRFFVQRGR